MFASYVIYSIMQTSISATTDDICLLVMLFIVLCRRESIEGLGGVSLLVMLFIVLCRL